MLGGLHGRGNLMTKKTSKKMHRFHHHKHANYTRILDEIREDYVARDQPDYLVIPYILMCATTLEARLNDELHGFATETWRDDYKTIADAYLSMSFRAKLDAVVPILTGNKFRMNPSHIVYKKLQSLISVRNRMVHPRPTVVSFESEMTAPHPSMPYELIEMLDDLTMGFAKEYSPIEYHEAIDKLERWVLHRCPDRLSKVALVVERI
jgi:hypothetical protein